MAFAAQWHTPHNRCVRFAPAVAGDHATLATGRPLRPTRTGLSPAGPRQLSWRTSNPWPQRKTGLLRYARNDEATATHPFCIPASQFPRVPDWSFPGLVYMISIISYLTGTLHDRPGRCNDRHRPAPGSIFDLPADRGARSTGSDRNPCHQYPAAVAAADGGVAPCLDRGGDGVDHGFPRGIRDRAIGGGADLGSLRPALAGADGLCGVLRRQHLVRPRHRLAEPFDRPRHQGRRPRLLAVAWRRARPLFRLAFRIRLCRRVRGLRRHRLWRGARRNPSFDPDPAQSAG